MPYFGFLLLVILFSLLTAASFLLAERCGKGVRFVASFMTFFMALPVLLTLLSGISGQVSVWPVLAGLALICVLMFLVRRRGRVTGNAPVFETVIPAGIVPFAVIAAILVLDLFIKALGNYVFVLPPTNWDSMWYHFTFALEWMKNATLAVPFQFGGVDPSPAFYPLNASLYYLFMLLPFGGTTDISLTLVPFLMNMANLGMVFILGLALFRSLPVAIFAAAFALSTKGLYNLGFVRFGNDYFVSFFYLLSFYWLADMWFRRQDFARDRIDFLKLILLFSISFGLALGTKYTSLPLLLPLFMFFVVFLMFAKTPKFFGILGFAMFLVAVACAGGYTYFRNYAGTGNPFFPAGFSLFGAQIFWPGLAENFGLNPFSLEVFFVSGGLPFMIAAGFFLITVLLFIYYKEKLADILFILIPVFSIVAFVIFSPPRQHFRFFLGPVQGVEVIAAYGFVWMILRIGPLGRPLDFARSLWYRVRSFVHLKPWLVRGAVMALVILAGTVLIVNVTKYQERKETALVAYRAHGVPVGRAWTALHGYTRNNPSRVSTTTLMIPYYLYGYQLQNEFVPLPPFQVKEKQMYDFGTRMHAEQLAAMLKKPSYETFIANLSALNIDFLVSASSDELYPLVKRAIQEKVLIPVFNFENVFVLSTGDFR